MGLKTKSATLAKKGINTPKVGINFQVVREQVMELDDQFFYSKEKLASDLGISIRTLRNWEQGIGTEICAKLKVLSQVTGISIDELIKELP